MNRGECLIFTLAPNIMFYLFLKADVKRHARRITDIINKPIADIEFQVNLDFEF